MPLFLALLAGFALSLVTALVVIPWVRAFALRRGWADQPDGHRKIHTSPIPNVGGVGIVVASLVGGGGLILARPWLPAEVAVVLVPPPLLLLAGAVLIAAVGFWDDLRDLHFRPKFFAQVAVSTLVILSGYRITVLDGVLGEGGFAFFASILLTLVWMVGTMNAVNMLDGMDGLAAGGVAIAFGGLVGVHAIQGDPVALVLAVAVVGALIGFLRYNFNPASIFMGDSGSLFLGYLLAAYALRGTAHPNPVLALVIPVVAMGLPILDTLLSISRRLYLRRSLFQPDRDHIHHRLALRTTHRRTVLILYTLSAFFALGAMTMAASTALVAGLVFLMGVVAVMVFLLQLVHLPWQPTPPPHAATPALAGEPVLTGELAPHGDGSKGGIAHSVTTGDGGGTLGEPVLPARPSR